MLVTEYDIRGIFKKDLDFNIIYNLVNRFFQDLKIKKILISSDFNKNNLKIKNFLKENFPAEDLGILPTPLFYFQVIKRKNPGVIITASHLPLKYSGLKFILETGDSWKIPKFKSQGGYLQIKKRNYKIQNSIKKELYENYFQKLKSIVKPNKKVFIEFDLKNFFLRTSLPYFRKLNIFHKKNSLIKIKSDYDNDRIYIFYKNKKILPDLIFYFLALNKKYKNLGVTINFSRKLKNLLQKEKKNIFFIKTGHSNFKKAFKKFNLDLAFEPSGHFYFFKDLKTESPYLALALFLHKFNVSQIISQSKINVYRMNLTIHHNFNLNKLISSLKKNFMLNLKKFDGYLLWNKDFYLHIRKSNTENKLRISYEGSKKYLIKIKKWFKKE